MVKSKAISLMQMTCTFGSDPCETIPASRSSHDTQMYTHMQHTNRSENILIIRWLCGKSAAFPKYLLRNIKKNENTLTQGLMTCKRFEWIRCLGSMRYQLIIIICYGNMSLNQRFNCSACINTHEIFKVFQVFKALTLFSNHEIRLIFLQ